MVRGMGLVFVPRLRKPNRIGSGVVAERCAPRSVGLVRGGMEWGNGSIGGKWEVEIRLKRRTHTARERSY